MPFERYLNAQVDSDAPPNTQRTAAYPSTKQDIPLDQSIFSNNVQFQVPQLMLGPTLPPGGGAEVLPAGIVGNANAVGSNWLSTPTFTRYSHDYWTLPPQEPLPISRPVILPSFCSSIQPQSSRKNLAAPTFDAASLPSSSTVTVSPQDGPPFDQRTLSSVASSLPTLASISLPLAVPNPGGLPVYSVSGFDLLSVLARVVTRPNPKIVLGPVDMTCSFVVVDVRRYDNPIVYASPTFCKLTGYAEREVVGRNCRFLQAPNGVVQRGEQRRHTAPEAVAHMRKSLTGDKECQASLINYRRDGSAFVNLVTVIPVRGGVHNIPEEADDVVYQVGFQVDLTEQPNAILQKLRDGSYMVNYSSDTARAPGSIKSDWKMNSSSASGISKSLRQLLNNGEFLQSIPFSTSTTTLSIAPQERHERNDPYDGNKPLSLLLLESSPDFLQVLSLKGAFLYVSPSVRRVLGYAPEDLVGKSIADFCHDADKIPLVRELKESSAPSTYTSLTGDASQDSQPSSSQRPVTSSAGPRVVDLLFRIRVKNASYVWLECRGRLYVEPGKGRKAIILSGRVRTVASLIWASISRAGGLTLPGHQISRKDDTIVSQACEQEFWAFLSTGGSFLFAGTAVRDVLGWGAGEVMGRSLYDFIGGHDPIEARFVIEDILHKAFTDPSLETRNVSCVMNRKDGSQVAVEVVFYHPSSDHQPWLPSPSRNPQRPLVCQVKVSSGATSPSTPARLTHANNDEVFDELDVGRESSWQYELQQLKFANQRLREEVEALEAHIQQESEAQVRARILQEHGHHQQSAYALPWVAHSRNMPRFDRTASKRTWGGDVIGYTG